MKWELSRAIMALLALGLPASGLADEAAETMAPGKIVPEKPASQFRDPDDGQIDLSRFLAKPRAFLPIPLVVTEPAVGYGGGLAGMFVRPREKAGGAGFAKPNISILGGIATENGTKAAFGADMSRWFDDRFKTLSAAGTGKINLDFYGLGLDEESLDEPVSYTLDFDLALMQGNWRVKADSPWSIGLRYIYSAVEPKLRDEPQFPGLADGIHVKVSAPVALLEFDTRDNLFTPTRGAYSESSYLVSSEDLGASEDFERFQQVLMGWFPVADRMVLGIRGDYQWSSNGTPFFLRPYVKLRGVPAMRYQGEEMASVEAELRWQFKGRWSAVFAAGYGAAKTDNDLFSRTRDVTSGVVGFRYELARKFGMHAGMDVGFSNDTTAIYLQVGNAWFRP
jgi:hypothetical protein